MMHPSPHHARAAAVLGAALALVSLSGCAAGSPEDRAATRSAAAPTPSASATATPVPGIPDSVPRTDIDSRAAPQGAPAEPPSRVSVPSLGIDMPVEPVGLAPGGDVSIPSASHTAGWYRYSSGMLDRSGSIVVVAHIDAWDGIGPFSKLTDASAGTVVELRGDAGMRTFRVDGKAQPQKAPGSLTSFFVATGPARLVLITCGGTFDESTGHYRDNVIVTATPIDG
ncbi:hypothetical protein J2W45_003267 [Leifsonia shinshuensis]|nr:hypothetical protein [Leifsonia shinshuensis]